MTENDALSEDLPVSPGALNRLSAARVDSSLALVEHRRWVQIMSEDGDSDDIVIVWEFTDTKTLQDRFQDAVDSGEDVTWTVFDYINNVTVTHSGEWRWSSEAGDMLERFDNGAGVDDSFSRNAGLFGACEEDGCEVDGRSGPSPGYGTGSEDSDERGYKWIAGVREDLGAMRTFMSVQGLFLFFFFIYFLKKKLFLIFFSGNGFVLHCVNFMHR